MVCRRFLHQHVKRSWPAVCSACCRRRQQCLLFFQMEGGREGGRVFFWSPPSPRSQSEAASHKEGPMHTAQHAERYPPSRHMSGVSQSCQNGKQQSACQGKARRAFCSMFLLPVLPFSFSFSFFLFRMIGGRRQVWQAEKACLPPPRLPAACLPSPASLPSAVVPSQNPCSKFFLETETEAKGHLGRQRHLLFLFLFLFA